MQVSETNPGGTPDTFALGPAAITAGAVSIVAIKLDTVLKKGS